MVVSKVKNENQFKECFTSVTSVLSDTCLSKHVNSAALISNCQVQSIKRNKIHRHQNWGGAC